MTVTAIPQVKWRTTTLLATGSGLSAAAGCGFLPLPMMLLLLVPLFFLPWRRSLILLFISAIAFLSGMNYLHRRDETDKIFRQSVGSVSGVLTITDSRATKVPGLNMPSRFRGEFECDGVAGKLPVTVALPENAPLLQWGGRYRINGILNPPRAAGYYVADGKITGEIPPPFVSNRYLRVTEIRDEVPGGSVKKFFASIRDVAVRRLVSGIKSIQLRSMAARLFCGASDGASAEIKEFFVLSGTIHLFAVSGMHVGALMFLLLWLTRQLPFKLRYLLTAAIIAVYIPVSGMSVPVLRAGMIIIIWCVCRSMLYMVSAWNIVMLTWSAIMIISPEKSDDIGTLYSFGITAALILAFEKLRILRKKLNFESALMPSRSRKSWDFNRRTYRLYQRLSLLTASVTAFFAGSALSLSRQYLLLPGSVAANLLVPFVTPLLFAVVFFKLLAGSCFHWCDMFGAWLLDKCFAVISITAEIVSEIFAPLAAITPNKYEVLIFYILFFFALSTSKLKSAIISGSLAIALLLSWCLRFQLCDSELMIFSGGAERPVSVVYVPGAESERAYVLNAPDPWTGILTGVELRRAGYNEAELSFSAGVSGTSGGTASLEKRMVKLYIENFSGRKNSYFKNNIRRAAGAEFLTERQRPSEGVWQNDKTLEWVFPDGLKVTAVNGDRGRMVTVNTADGRKMVDLLPWSNSVMCRKFNLTE